MELFDSIQNSFLFTSIISSSADFFFLLLLGCKNADDEAVEDADEEEAELVTLAVSSWRDRFLEALSSAFWGFLYNDKHFKE